MMLQIFSQNVFINAHASKYGNGSCAICPHSATVQTRIVIARLHKKMCLICKKKNARTVPNRSFSWDQMARSPADPLHPTPLLPLPTGSRWSFACRLASLRSRPCLLLSAAPRWSAPLHRWPPSPPPHCPLPASSSPQQSSASPNAASPCPTRCLLPPGFACCHLTL
jgi:hypothetical protein